MLAPLELVQLQLLGTASIHQLGEHLLEQWLRQPGSRLLNWIWKLHLVFLCGALGLPLAGWLDLSSTFPVFDGLFLVSLLLMGVVAIRHYRSLSREQQVILVAYGLYAGLLVADMAVAHGVVPWERIPVSWGALAFSVAVVSVSIRQYSRAHKDLAALNLSSNHISEIENLEPLSRGETGAYIRHRLQVAGLGPGTELFPPRVVRAAGGD